MSNVSWRTPGADGGRDLEGQHLHVDLSGEIRLESWYVECKRYSSSLDWPTVFGKLAYAENAGADFLLLCTNSTLSPACKNEVSRRESRRLTPKIRAWEGPQLERLIARESILLAKYNLSEGASLETSALPLLRLAAKSSDAAYGAAVLAGICHPALEFSAALLELATALLDNGIRSGAGRRFLPARDLYSWAHTTDRDGSPKDFDSYGVRALLAAARFLSRGKEPVEIQFQTSNRGFLMIIKPYPATPVGIEIATTIALLSDLEINMTHSNTLWVGNRLPI